MSVYEIKSRIVANNILPIFTIGFIITNMDKMKSLLKKLFAPAVVLLLVAVMGVFSPIASVAAALRVNTMADAGLNGSANYTISNLPANSVEVGKEIDVPQVTSGSVKLCHAGQTVDSFTGGKYTYNEIGQYEWRFYDTNGKLYDTRKVSVTDTKYSMTMPDNVITVAPKDLGTLTLPLPKTYTVASKAVEIESINSVGHYATLKVKDSQNAYDYVLKASVSLANNTFADDRITIDQNLEVDLPADITGNLKVAYYLYDQSGNKLLSVLPLSDIEFKNVKKNEVTFDNVPTAPSVKSLAYYSSVSLTAPTIDSAKFGTTSFNVEADTTIVKIQCYLYSTEPSKWTDSKVHNLTVEKDGNGKWIIKEGNQIVDQYLEIDGLTVKIKKLGWYRFQFETSTLFGYNLDEDFDMDSVDIEQNSNKSYVRYWSDSIRIYRDSVEPNFAWVDAYDKTSDTVVSDMNENFDDLLDVYTDYLPMTEQPSVTASKKITVNPNDGLALPAIFPHDNASSFANLKITAFNIDQIQDENGNSVSNENYVWNGSSSSSTSFVYDQTNRVQISFVNDDNSRINTNNNVQLLNRNGLYRVRITVEETEPKFEDEGAEYSSGYANTKTKYLYFYVSDSFDSSTSSPVIDANNTFQVSDVYLWEGSTFDFAKPSFSDNNTETNKLVTDYYLVGQSTSQITILSKLGTTASASRITVDLNDLYQWDTLNNIATETKLDFDTVKANYDSYYVYAVARNFNAMQANLKVAMGITTPDANNVLDNEKYFRTGLFTKLNTSDEVSQYGYTWKRTEFKIHDIANSLTPTISVDFNTSDNTYKAGKAVHIDNIKAQWSSKVDGQLSVTVYLVKENNKLVAVDLKNGNDAASEIISSVSFNRAEYSVDDWYFTPGVGGNYMVVVTAKDNVSSKIYTYIQNVKISSSGEWNWGGLNTAAEQNHTIDASLQLGESLTMPSRILSMDNKAVYFAKNRALYEYDSNGLVSDTVKGNYTITVLNQNDARCITGNKFIPNQEGLYILQYAFYEDGATDPFLIKNYNVQVNNDVTGSATILMGEDYSTETVIWNASHTTGTVSDATVKYGINGEVYTLDAQYTQTKPAYAITLNQFTMSNYGASTDFVIDSKSLYEYLEPIYENGQITAYVYPAIAIPMPNVVADTYSSDEVEITVQKSGSSSYLVSSKKRNAGGSGNKESEIEKIGGYYVFRPEGKFKVACKTEGNANNYLEYANSLNGAAGLYTVTYKTNNTSVSYNLTFGNLENGTLTWNKGFLTYDNDDGKGKQEIVKSDSSENVVIEEIDGHRYVTIDMTKVYFEGNDDMEDLIAKGVKDDASYSDEIKKYEYYMQNVSVWVSYEDGDFISSSDWSTSDDETEAIKIYTEGESYLYKFDLSRGSGTYKVHISMPNKYTGSTVSDSIEFSIDVTVSNRNYNLNNVWGIILIVLSLGLLAGVVYYFIKTSRATRFVDVPQAAKGKKKTPKAVEAPKDDVK